MDGDRSKEKSPRKDTSDAFSSKSANYFTYRKALSERVFIYLPPYFPNQFAP